MSNLTYSYMPNLQTKRCILRMMTLDDSQDLFHVYKNKEHVKLLPFKHHKNISDTKRFIQSFFIDNYKKGKIGHYAIMLKGSNKVIGNIGFNNIYPDDTEGEIGVCLHPNYCGDGLIHEILKEILKYGFVHLKLNRIYAIAFEGNIASMNILKHYNFNYLGKTKTIVKGKSKKTTCHIFDMYSNQYFNKLIYRILSFNNLFDVM
ncbi:MAG: GNAT family N-acetyltransferase [Paraclostridium sp.]